MSTEPTSSKYFHHSRGSAPNKSSLQRESNPEVKHRQMGRASHPRVHHNPKSAAQRAALKRKPKSVKSPIGHLPAEILTIIFQGLWSFHDRAENKYRILLIIGAVSSAWRQTAYSNPQLWTSIDFKVSSSLSSAYHIGQLLHLFLKNSADLLLTLKLRFQKESCSGKILVDSDVDDLIIKNMHRIRSLELINPPLGWYHIPPYVELPHLTTFSFLCNRIQVLEPSEISAGPDLRFLSASSTLRRLNFFPYRLIFKIEVPYNALTSVHLHGVSLLACIDLLIRCPNIAEFRPEGNLSYHRFGFGDLTPGYEEIIRDKIKFFCWGQWKHLANRDLLRSLRLPSLQTLLWTPNSGGYDEMAAAARDFLNNLPPTLSTLQLNSCGSHVRPLLKNTNIKHLILANHSDTRILEGLSSEGFFPGLNKLTIIDSPQNLSPSTPLAAPLITRFVQVVLSTQMTRQFCIETVSLQVGWTDEEKRLLKGFVDGGMKLEVIQDSQSVDWL